ncbi:peptide chain release factor N(5)-glutamine methyltransferase [Propionispira raffinosivorans]|uniref:peptide chain release factor N(5)-glutamine methyltransferase n=1 Tax=Propionispira raffinosivorans TaxID=86959 RepID=UPI00035DCC98|nr:peptide chain release factor N(5)-glutamine methyltransferase [Propionispira raffinosivorans]
MAMKNEVWTIGSIIKWTEQYFRDKGVDSPRLDAEVLLSHVLKKERIYLYIHFDEPLEAAELASFRDMVKKRVQRIPVAYIVGAREFMGLTFAVSPMVLIPRPDTEILVEAVIERFKDKAQIKFVDIGTGSGAIVLSLLHYLPLACAAAVDISQDALTVAAENAETLLVKDRVDFYLGDVYAPLTAEKFDAIISNPPYIPNEDIAELEPEVRDFEPYGALAGGMDGLDFYRRLIVGGSERLKDGGFMAFEVGINQAGTVAALAESIPELGKAEILKDYAGIERVVILYKK